MPRTGAPVGFKGSVYPNPTNAKVSKDTDPQPTKLAGAKLSLPRSGGKPSMSTSNPAMNQIERHPVEELFDPSRKPLIRHSPGRGIPSSSPLLTEH